jgi:hypothetical protein
MIEAKVPDINFCPKARAIAESRVLVKEKIIRVGKKRAVYPDAILESHRTSPFLTFGTPTSIVIGAIKVPAMFKVLSPCPAG